MLWIALLVASPAWGQPSAAVQAQLASVARQREAVRRQMSATLPAAAREASMAGGCEALAEEDAAVLVEGAAKAQQLPSKLVRAVVARESAFQPCVQSKKGAKGLMQLMPATAAEFDVAEPFDAEANVAAGTKYLRRLLERYKGDLRLALAAYNAGPSVVDAAGRVPDIAETRDYVEAIVGSTGIEHIEFSKPPSLPAR